MSKKLNIIEAMKMPIGTKFEVILNGEKFGCVAKIIESKVASKKQLVWDNRADTQVFVNDSISNATFIPIQKPVSFMEVVNSKMQCRVEYEKYEIDTNYFSLNDILRFLVEKEFNIKEIIKEGKWYIEESEGDSDE